MNYLWRSLLGCHTLCPVLVSGMLGGELWPFDDNSLLSFVSFEFETILLLERKTLLPTMRD